MDVWTLVMWLADAVVALFAGYYLGMWRGTCKGHADVVNDSLSSTVVLGKFFKGDVARKGGLEGVAKGIRFEEAFNSVVDDMFSRMETLRMASMAAEYVFYALLVAFAVGGHYPAPVIGIPVCLMTVRQAVKDKGQPLGVQMLLRLFGIFHVWLKEHPMDAFNYTKTSKNPVQNLTGLLRESGSYAL